MDHFHQSSEIQDRGHNTCPSENAEFVHLLLSAATDTIPHGFCKAYTPCWTAESERLLKEPNKFRKRDTAQALIEALDTECLKHWKELVESTDFTHSNCKA